MADILLKLANLSEIPLRVLATLPTTLPMAGYANLLCKDTVDGKRAYLRLPDGSLVNLFTVNTVTDNTITNSTTIYDISDLPDPSTLTAGSFPVIVDTAGVKSWGWNLVNTLIAYLSIQAHRQIATPVTSLTFQHTDSDTYQNCLNTSTLTLTVPSTTTIFNVGTEIEVARNATGAVMVTPASGVTINGVTASISVSKQYGIIVLKLIANNTWVAYGDLA